MAGELSRRLADTRRILDLERLAKKEPVTGDWEGSVTGSYQKKNSDGTVTVMYNSKEYVARPQAQYMAVKDDIVTITFRAGIYIASW